MKILVADDHDGIVYFVTNYISGCFDNVEVVEFREGEAVIKEVSRNRYDIYILDIEFRDIIGFDVIKGIRKIHKNAKIIVYSMHEEIWYINELKHINVDGIVLKSSPVECLKDAIIQVYNGEKYYCGHFSELQEPYNLKNPNSDLLLENFSEKDLEILKLIAEGYTTKEIANKLGWGEETVKSYRKNRLLKKFNVKNPTSLIARAISQKYIRDINLRDDD